MGLKEQILRILSRKSIYSKHGFNRTGAASEIVDLISKYEKLIEAYEELDKLLSIMPMSLDAVTDKHSKIFHARLKIETLKNQLNEKVQINSKDNKKR